MAFSVDGFRAQMSGDGARTAFFDVIMTGPSWVGFPGSKFSFMCKSAQLPTSTIGEKVVPYFGHDVHFAGDRTFEDWSVTAYNDEDFLVRNAFEKWLDGMDRNSQDGSMRGDGATSSPSSYVGTATVQQYGKEGSVIKTYEFVNIWPSSLGSISVDWDTKDEIETFEITFKYDYWKAITTT